MKDSDSSPDKTENADDMSLADLLGAGDGKAEEAPLRRVEHRDDEPDSGMVNLAKMVAASSVEVAKMPSIAPPAPPAAEPSGVAPVQPRDPSGVVTTQAAAPVAAAPKKSGGAIYALIAVVVIAAVVIGYFAMSKGDGGDDTAAMKMMAEMQAKAEADRKAAEEKEAKLLAKLEELSKAAAAGSGQVSAEDQAKMDAVKAQLDAAQAEKEAAAKKAEEAKASSAGGTSSKPAADKPKKESAPEPKKETAKKPDTGGATGSKPTSGDKKPEAPKSGGSSELDSLLGGGSKEKPEEKPAAKPADDTPKQPTKEQVNTAMAPIKAKAQASCAKYSTGTVQVQMAVSSDGKVKSASALGAFAGNPAGTCVAMMARSAKFPKFKDPTFTFTYPIVLQ